jgi:hypothetical protein
MALNEKLGIKQAAAALHGDGRHNCCTAHCCTVMVWAMALDLQVYAGQGPKWRLMYALFSHPDWEQLSRQYKAVMVADENVGLSTQTVNK